MDLASVVVKEELEEGGAGDVEVDIDISYKVEVGDGNETEIEQGPVSLHSPSVALDEVKLEEVKCERSPCDFDLDPLRMEMEMEGEATNSSDHDLHCSVSDIGSSSELSDVESHHNPKNVSKYKRGWIRERGSEWKALTMPLPMALPREPPFVAIDRLTLADLRGWGIVLPCTSAPGTNCPWKAKYKETLDKVGNGPLVRAHQGDIPFKCTHCNLFMRRREFQNHITSAHPQAQLKITDKFSQKKPVNMSTVESIPTNKRKSNSKATVISRAKSTSKTSKVKSSRAKKSKPRKTKTKPKRSVFNTFIVR